MDNNQSYFFLKMKKSLAPTSIIFDYCDMYFVTLACNLENIKNSSLQLDCRNHLVQGKSLSLQLVGLLYLVENSRNCKFSLYPSRSLLPLNTLLCSSYWSTWKDWSIEYLWHTFYLKLINLLCILCYMWLCMWGHLLRNPSSFTVARRRRDPSWLSDFGWVGWKGKGQPS